MDLTEAVHILEVLLVQIGNDRLRIKLWVVQKAQQATQPLML